LTDEQVEVLNPAGWSIYLVLGWEMGDEELFKEFQNPAKRLKP